METLTIPLVGNPLIRDWNSTSTLSSYTKGQVFINHEFFKVVNPHTKNETLFSKHRPGLYNVGVYASGFTLFRKFFPWWGYSNNTGTSVTTGTDSGTGRTRLYVAGDAYSYVYGSGSNTITHISEARNSSGTVSILITRDDQGFGAAIDYYLYPAGGAMTNITVPANSKGGMVTIKGWTFVANLDGKIYNSNLNDPTTGYTDFIAADLFPDGLLDLVKYKDKLVAFGPQTMEVFEVVENTTGSPLRYLPQFHKKIGLAAGGTYKAYTYGRDSVFFLGSGQEFPTYGIYVLKNNLDVEEVSISAIRNPLWTSGGFGPNYLTIGAKDYLITPLNLSGSFPSALVYDIELDLWHIWAVSGISLSWLSFSNIPSSSLVIGQGISNNNAVAFLHEASAFHTFQDNSSNVTRTIITSPVEFGNRNWKRIDYVKIIGDVQSSSALVSISWSDDGGVTFTTARTIDLSSTNAAIYGCGSTKSRIFKIEDSLNGEYRYRELEIGYTIGSH